MTHQKQMARRARQFRILTLAVWIGAAALAHADYLKVLRPATLKARPENGAQVVAPVQDEAVLKLLDEGKQDAGYYHAALAGSGESGWIYRTFVRRFPGGIPSPAAAGGHSDPLGDPTYKLPENLRVFAGRHLRVGKPQAVFERVREGYVVAQDARLKIPVWVQYELKREELGGPAERADDFRADTSIPLGVRSELGDFGGSGFDRGHMAPAEDMSRNSRLMSESFLLSNMAPQVGLGFNRRIWKNLEAAARGWVQQRETLTIITGPVFAEDTGRVQYQVIGKNKVAVPTHFYKIVVDAREARQVEALAFLIPNQDLGDKDFGDYLASIDEIEALTGLDFLSALPPEVQRNVEKQKADRVW